MRATRSPLDTRGSREVLDVGREAQLTRARALTTSGRRLALAVDAAVYPAQPVPRMMTCRMGTEERVRGGLSHTRPRVAAPNGGGSHAVMSVRRRCRTRDKLSRRTPDHDVKLRATPPTRLLRPCSVGQSLLPGRNSTGTTSAARAPAFRRDRLLLSSGSERPGRFCTAVREVECLRYKRRRDRPAHAVGRGREAALTLPIRWKVGSAT